MRKDGGDPLGDGTDLRWLSHMLGPLGHTTNATAAAGLAGGQRDAEIAIMPTLGTRHHTQAAAYLHQGVP